MFDFGRTKKKEMYEQTFDSTDAVINELKVLARSMLEATNLARSKTRSWIVSQNANICSNENISNYSQPQDVLAFNSNSSSKEIIIRSNENTTDVDNKFNNIEDTEMLNAKGKINLPIKETSKCSRVFDNCANYPTNENLVDNTNDLSKKAVVIDTNKILTATEKQVNDRSHRLPQRTSKIHANNKYTKTEQPFSSIKKECDCQSRNGNVNRKSDYSALIKKKEVLPSEMESLNTVLESHNSLVCNRERQLEDDVNSHSKDEKYALPNDIINDDNSVSSRVNECMELTSDRIDEYNFVDEKNMRKNEKVSYEEHEEEELHELLEVITKFTKIKDGVCTTNLTVKNAHTHKNVDSKTVNINNEWFDFMINSLWSAEPHTRFFVAPTNSINNSNINTAVQIELQIHNKKKVMNKLSEEQSPNYIDDNVIATNESQEQKSEGYNNIKESKNYCETNNNATKVFRVPSFPFGGGISLSQALYLQLKFNQVLLEEIHNSQHTNSRDVDTYDNVNEESNNYNFIDNIREKLTREEQRPQLITLKAFTERHVLKENNYKDSINSIKTNLCDFKPQSPYQFVMEIERGIIFDAVNARCERLERFRREVEENSNLPTIPETFNLPIIMDPLRTGFQEEKNFPIIINDVIARRYQVIELLGKATFSRAVRCYDLEQPIYDYYECDDEEEVNYYDSKNYNNDDIAREEYFNTGGNVMLNVTPIDCKETSELTGHLHEENKVAVCADATSLKVQEFSSLGEQVRKKHLARSLVGYAEVCLKIINNSKDFFDQSLDEIRLLKFINGYKDADEAHVIRLIDAFYYKEHTMLVTELLSDNLYEYSKYNRENEKEPYFTLERLRSIAIQITEALAYIHSLKLIHADLKPENILFVSHSRCIVKIIDFGSSCFISDHLSSYIQSRSYRAPEVILGCDYDGRIDVWSLGAILVELVTGQVLFPSKTIPDMLARIVHVCGTPLPRSMLWEGRHTCTYINKFGCIYEIINDNKLTRDSEDGKNNFKYNDTFLDNMENDIANYNKHPYNSKILSINIYTPINYQQTDNKHCSKKMSSNSSGDTIKENVTEIIRGDTNINAEQSLTGAFTVLCEKLTAAGMKDKLFISFVEACLQLDHKQRLTSQQLLLHPFLRDIEEEKQ